MNDELKSYYTDTMDFAYVDQIWHHIRDEMLNLLKNETPRLSIA